MNTDSIRSKGSVLLSLLIIAFFITGSPAAVFADDDPAPAESTPQSGKIEDTRIGGMINGAGAAVAGAAQGADQVLSGFGDGTEQVLQGFGAGVEKTVNGFSVGTGEVVGGIVDGKKKESK